jgi:multidrug efflux system membrane fusion protein
MSESHQSLGIHAGGEAERHAPRGPMMRRARIAVVIILILLAIGAVRTVVARILDSHELDRRTTTQATQYVNVISPDQSNGGTAVELPGTLQGLVESPIYARSNGYLVSWSKDIGAHVEKGELLATISSPEVDQELSQAVATRQQQVSSLALAKSSAERWQALRQKDAVSQQELDERQSAYTQAQANLAAAEANVKRLQELEGFTRIVAPFAGTITRRNVDVGDLIDSGSGGTGRPLFTLAKVDPLRLYIYVPQTDSEVVHPGATVTVTQSELPGQQFQGVIARTAGAIDTATRTLQVEVQLPNHDGRLLPGAYVEVRVPTTSRQALIVPVNTLLFRKEGIRIAVVDNGNVARLIPVSIGKDYGEKVEIVNGLKATDRVILNPADALMDGQPVTVVQPKQEAPSGPGANQQAKNDQGEDGKDGDDAKKAKPESIKEKTTSK